MKNLNAFTLAEVLITLGIIGVVAAMTMPTVINQTNGAQYKAAYKKALSVISQAVTLNYSLDDYDFSSCVFQNSNSPKLEELIKNRMHVVKDEDINTGNNYIKNVSAGGVQGIGFDSVAYSHAFYFNDGSAFFYAGRSNGACTEDSMCYGVIDVNGEKKPNKFVSCDSTSANQMDDADNLTDTMHYGTGTGDCVVSKPTDIYPVYFYNQSVIPATKAAKAVLYGK